MTVPSRVLPVVVVLGIFVGYPFLYGVWLSLTDTTIVSAGTFIGLDNFVRLLSNSIFLQAASNSFVYTGITTVLKLVLGLGIYFLYGIRHSRLRRQDDLRNS